MALVCSLSLAAGLFSARGSALAGDDPLAPTAPHRTTPEPPVERPKASLDDDEETPEPPLVKASAGIIAWPYLRTSLQFGRHRRSGPELENAEDTIGLADRAISPWLEASVGTTVRVGFSFLDLDRLGSFTEMKKPLSLAGIDVAQGDFARLDLHYTQGEAFVQWNALRGPRYRFGLIGGARLIRFGTRFQTVSLAHGLRVETLSTEQYAFSPLLGGSFELDPASFCTIYASIRFIDWAWERINLHDQRTFDFRIGARVAIVDDLLEVGLEFRYLSVFVDPARFDGRTKARIDIDGAGLGFTATVHF